MRSQRSTNFTGRDHPAPWRTLSVRKLIAESIDQLEVRVL